MFLQMFTVANETNLRDEVGRDDSASEKQLMLISKYPVESILAVNEDNETALHIAAKNKNMDLVNSFLKHLLVS